MVAVHQSLATYTRLDYRAISDTMPRVQDVVVGMRQNPRNVRYSDLCQVCEYYFGPPRQEGTSHRIYRTPWPGDPRVNIQNDHGKAKSYQVKQVLAAIDRLLGQDNVKK